MDCGYNLRRKSGGSEVDVEERLAKVDRGSWVGVELKKETVRGIAESVEKNRVKPAPRFLHGGGIINGLLQD